MPSDVPHAGISAVIGLLEILDDAGGHEDLFQLGRQLQFDLEDLLPVTESAELLGFVTVEQGDITLTELGKRLLSEDINDRKSIVREQLLKLKRFQEIIATLEARKHGAMERSFFADMLAMHESEADAERRLKWIIDWARYAELFDYDHNSDELRLRRVE